MQKLAHVGVQVTDIEAEYERVKTLGVEFVDPKPREFSGGKLFFIKGPDGESIEFCSAIQIDPI